MKEKMPNKIYVTPRGSGTVSGIYVDYPLGDEDRGEHEYVRADLIEKIIGDAWEAALGWDCFTDGPCNEYAPNKEEYIKSLVSTKEEDKNNIEMTNKEIVLKLIGKITPIGETNEDMDRLENLKLVCSLITGLVNDVSYVSGEYSNRHEYSMKISGEYAQKFLDELRKSLANE